MSYATVLNLPWKRIGAKIIDAHGITIAKTDPFRSDSIAPLLLAAPEMLKLLEEVFDKAIDTEAQTIIGAWCFANIRDVLAKAKGEVDEQKA